MANKTKARPSGNVHGVLLVDKPTGLSSHDVVSRVRRVFGTRRVGHAGTLDPMATGVLVVLLGEATKLSSVLTTDRKSYRTTLRLGVATDSLDKDGKVTVEKPLDRPLYVDDIQAALSEERARKAQIPPQVSAIKVDGQRAYERARKGETTTLEPRIVAVHDLRLLEFDHESISLELTVSKGYYVRSLARDLAERLGTVAHLTELRRLTSGPFSESETHPFPLEDTIPLVSVERAAQRCLPQLYVNEEGAQCVNQGKRLVQEAILRSAPPLDNPSGEEKDTYAAFFEERLIALMEASDRSEYKVKRGINGKGE